MSEDEVPRPLALADVPQPRLGDRSLFPNLRAKAYLAHAAISPASMAVTRSVQHAVELVARKGVGSFPLLGAQRERLRASLGRLWGVPSQQVVLSPGCTRAISDVALSLDWKPGDRLFTYRGEFPANVTPWQLAARRFGGEVVLGELPSPTDPECAIRIVDDLAAAFEHARASGAKLRWVAASAVQFQTGLRLPLAEMAAICRQNGARLLVDGIQASGVVPLDLERLGVDAFFVGAHKWMLGLEGVGAAYISEELMAELDPITAGWLSHVDGDWFLFRGAGHLRYDRPLVDSPAVFEGSTLSGLGFVALEAGVDVLLALHPAEIFSHVQSYHDAIELLLVERGFESLRAADPGLRSTILSFRPPDGTDVPALAAALRARGIVPSTPDGLVRLAPHFANRKDEVALVLEALDEALQSVRS